MKKLLLLLLSFAILPIAFAQTNIQYPEADADALLVQPFYTEGFESLPNEPELWVAARLFKLDMQAMVDQNIIHRDDMKGLALPLGIHNRPQHFVDFSQGMLDMWREKAEFVARKNAKVSALTMLKALDFVEIARNRATRSTIREYRSEVLSPALEKIKAIHQQKKDAFSDDRRVFMDIFLDNFSPNVMLGYNIQELIPPTHMVKGKILSINPLFKAYYIDRMLQEGGIEILEGFPARFDALLSHGPFQMTNLALDGINENKRLFDEFKLFKAVEDLNNIHDHALVAAIFAYYNWEMLSYSLKASGKIDAFNQYFANYATDELLQRKLRILIAGITACMHHQPARSRRMMTQVIAGGDFEGIHHQILVTDAADKQLIKYYRSAAEAYLLMKVYHTMADKYGK